MVYIINTAIVPFIGGSVMYDVAHVMREVAKIKRQRDLVKGSLIPQDAKDKLLRDLDAQERAIAASVVEAPKGAVK